jgi:hypothetical protein
VLIPDVCARSNEIASPVAIAAATVVIDVIVVVAESKHPPNHPYELHKVMVRVVIDVLVVVGVFSASSRHPHQPGVLQVLDDNDCEEVVLDIVDVFVILL